MMIFTNQALFWKFSIFENFQFLKYMKNFNFSKTDIKSLKIHFSLLEIITKMMISINQSLSVTKFPFLYQIVESSYYLHWIHIS